MKTLRKEVEVKLDPIDVASLFCSMDDCDQALFFNTVAIMSQAWEEPFEFQMSGVSRSMIIPLTDGGRKIMKTIGEYAEKPEA